MSLWVGLCGADWRLPWAMRQDGQVLLEIALADDAGHQVWVDGFDPAGVHVSDLEKRVPVAPGATLAVDDLADPPIPFVGLHQHCVATLNREESWEERCVAAKSPLSPQTSSSCC